VSRFLITHQHQFDSHWFSGKYRRQIKDDTETKYNSEKVKQHKIQQNRTILV